MTSDDLDPEPGAEPGWDNYDSIHLWPLDRAYASPDRTAYRTVPARYIGGGAGNGVGVAGYEWMVYVYTYTWYRSNNNSEARWERENASFYAAFISIFAFVRH